MSYGGCIKAGRPRGATTRVGGQDGCGKVQIPTSSIHSVGVIIIFHLASLGRTFVLGTTPMLVVMFLILLCSIPPIAVTKLMVKEPSCNPVWTVVISIVGKLPVVGGVLAPPGSNSLHSLILGLLLEIAPVIWRLTLAVVLQMGFLGGQPVVDSVCLLLQ